MDLSVELYDKAFQRVGWLGGASSVTVTWRYNRRGSASIVLPADHVRAAAIVAPGARVVITYTPDGGVPQRFSGRVSSVQVQGPLASSVATVTVAGDWIDRVLGWPVPAAALTAQSVEHYTAAGAAETVIKAAISANATRLSLPWTVASSSGRGSTVALSVRFAPLAEALEAAADLGGVGLSMVQNGSTIGVDCYVGTDRTARVLSEAGATVTAWSLTVSEPQATRVVVGLQGEGTARTFLSSPDLTVEALWEKAEAFVDANDLSNPTAGAVRGTDKLAELAPTSTVSATLAETDAWRYGRNAFLGDVVSVETLPGVVRQDRIREARLSWTDDNGLTVEPVIGDPDATDPERVLASQLRQIASGVRRLRAR